VITIHQRYRRTDRRTDGRTDGQTDAMQSQYRAMHNSASRGKNWGNLHTVQPTLYGFSSSDARTGEFTTNEMAHMDSRDQSGPSYRPKTSAQYDEGHYRDNSNYGDALQVDRGHHADKKRITGASHKSAVDAFQYQELLLCIKRQEDEIAQLRQACTSMHENLVRMSLQKMIDAYITTAVCQLILGANLAHHVRHRSTPVIRIKVPASVQSVHSHVKVEFDEKSTSVWT